MKRWADKTGRSVIKYPEMRHESCQFSEEEWFVSGIRRRRVPFTGNLSILNQQSTRAVNCWQEIQKECIVTRRQMIETTGFRTEQGIYSIRSYDGVWWSSNFNILIISLSWIGVLFCCFGSFLLQMNYLGRSRTAKRVQYSVSRIHYSPEFHTRKERMFEYVVNYFWLERKSDSSIGNISDRLSEGTDSIPVLVLWSFLISLSCLSRHIHVDTFALLCRHCKGIIF